jgi:DNA-binding SARP family transcriptional activator
LADVVARAIHHLAPLLEVIESSVQKWPQRWLPVLRRTMDAGDDPRAYVAAGLLDRHGAMEDIGRLRAFEKTYRRRGVTSGLGRGLARRVSPRAMIADLGHGTISIGTRRVEIGRIRRRSGAVLMYLLTRPNFTATREQIIEDIWPDGDLDGGANSLNQSLYFLRREIDPWYEDDISPSYVAFGSELVSLDQELVQSDSSEFLKSSRALMSHPFDLGRGTDLIRRYRGHFAPEFEYEEWALGWRSRVHAAYLDFCGFSIRELAAVRDYRAACDFALTALSIDPDASDIERALVWLYSRAGAESAAERQYTHWARGQRADGLTPPSLNALLGDPNVP